MPQWQEVGREVQANTHSINKITIYGISGRPQTHTYSYTYNICMCVPVDPPLSRISGIGTGHGNAERDKTSPSFAVFISMHELFMAQKRLRTNLSG